jgi:hypothetical protein
MRDRSQIGTEKSSVSSRQIRPESKDYFARGTTKDLQSSKRVDTSRSAQERTVINQELQCVDLRPARVAGRFRLGLAIQVGEPA